MSENDLNTALQDRGYRKDRRRILQGTTRTRKQHRGFVGLKISKAAKDEMNERMRWNEETGRTNGKEQAEQEVTEMPASNMSFPETIAAARNQTVREWQGF
jgi:hypothetical protein